MELDQQGGVSRGVRHWASLVRRDSAIYMAIVLYIVAAGIAASLVGAGERFSVLVYPAATVKVLVVMAGSALVVFTAYTVLIVKPASPLGHVRATLSRFLISDDLFRSVPLLVTFSFFFSAVSSFKTLIPVFNPFVWDADFIWLDGWLHGGTQPWEWLQPVLGYPPVTLVINFVYNLWFFIMFLALFWQLLDSRHAHRRQCFLLSFVLIWAVNGSLLAVVFSSAGPCFLDRLFPEVINPFAGLMTYLNHANQSLPIWAIPTQDALWTLYQDKRVDAGAGISAMPSMHVSVAWLIFLLVRKEVCWLRWLGRVFVAFILIGSVHLGWHYAVDGYLAILTTTVIWWAVNRGLSGKRKDSEQRDVHG